MAQILDLVKVKEVGVNRNDEVKIYVDYACTGLAPPDARILLVKVDEKGNLEVTLDGKNLYIES